MAWRSTNTLQNLITWATKNERRSVPAQRVTTVLPGGKGWSGTQMYELIIIGLIGIWTISLLIVACAVRTAQPHDNDNYR